MEFDVFFLNIFSPRKNNYHFYPVLKVPDTKIGYNCFALRSQKRQPMENLITSINNLTTKRHCCLADKFMQSSCQTVSSSTLSISH